jgi:glycosyltransferase involved in cell wall biosynthesis
VKALRQSGYDIVLCCYYEHEGAMVSRFEQAGAKVVLLGLTRGHLRHLFSTLVRFFRSERPDVVHVQYFAPGMVPILAARRAGVKHVFATVHAAGREGYGWRAKAMLRFSARFTDHFFCVSRNAERFWFGSASSIGKRAGWSKAHHSTIHNGVDIEAIQAAGRFADRNRLCPELPPGAKVVGIVGRLVRLKGHLTLLQAMRDVLVAVPNVFLLVVGEGPDEATFRQEADRLRIADSVIWKGRVEPEALPQYYHAMDVLATPSYWEGFGLTAAEAMAAGKPVVATDVPGLREVVEDGGTGFLIPVGDPETLAAKLRHLLSHDAARTALGRRGLERVRRLFDVTVHNQKWLQAYASLLAGSAGTTTAAAVASE